MKADIKIGDLIVLDSVTINYIFRKRPYKVTHLTNAFVTCVAVDHLGNPLGGDNPEMQSSVQVKKKSVIAVLNSIEDFEVFSEINKHLDSKYTAYTDSMKSLEQIRDRVKATGELPTLDELEAKRGNWNPLDVSFTGVPNLKVTKNIAKFIWYKKAQYILLGFSISI